MEQFRIIIDTKDYNQTDRRFHRVAARGIIKQGNSYAMIYSSKFGEYKFPGGGLEEGEEPCDTLVREVREETGLIVVKESIEYIGKAEEVRKGMYDDILDMVSYYYICQVEKEIAQRNLDDYEKEYDYNLVYVSLSEAIQNNEKISEIKDIPWIIRDTAVMRELLKEESYVI